MKIEMKLVVISCLLILQGCNKNDIKPKSSGNPSGMDQNGSVVGNGLVVYSNANLDISFSYPSNWNLTESKDKNSVALTNDGLSSGQDVSTIEFKRLTKLNDKRIYKIQELEAELKVLFPGEVFKALQFVGNRPGFSTKSIDKSTGATSAKYYVLDENYNILSIILKAFPNFGGEDIVWSVIGSQVIDIDPPEILSISLDPAVAKPGDTITATVVAVDDASGVNSEDFQSPAQFVNDLSRSWFGYNVPHFSYERNDTPWFQNVSPGYRKAYEPAAAFPFTSSWIKISKIRFKYSFVVPKEAPAGQVVLANFSFKDMRGNRIFMTLEPSAAPAAIDPNPGDEGGKDNKFVNYLSFYDVTNEGRTVRKKTAIPAITVKINSEKSIAQNIDLQITNIFWEKSLITGLTNNLLIKTNKDASDIIAVGSSVLTYLSDVCGDGPPEYDHFAERFGNSTEILTGPIPNSEKDLLMVRVSFGSVNNCGQKYNSALRILENVVLRDKLGNIISIFKSDKFGYNKKDFTLDYLNKPVVYQEIF